MYFKSLMGPVCGQLHFVRIPNSYSNIPNLYYNIPSTQKGIQTCVYPRNTQYKCIFVSYNMLSSLVKQYGSVWHQRK